MTMPQQQPQQPAYPGDLGMVLDRHFNEFTSYTSSRFEELASQMRVADGDALLRDTDLANAVLRLGERLSNVETTQRAIITALTELRQDMATMRQELATMRQEIATMRQEMATMRQETADGFAAQAERHNELMVRVDKLERNGQK